MRTCARPPRAEPHRTLCTALLEIQRNQNRGNGNWSVGNVSSLSTRKASAVGERWATGASAQPTVHRLVLWTAQLSIAGAHSTTGTVAAATQLDTPGDQTMSIQSD